MGPGQRQGAAFGLEGHDVIALAPQIGCFATRENGVRSITIRNLANGEPRELLPVDDFWTMGAAFSPDGHVLAAGGFNFGVGVYQLAAAKLSAFYKGQQDFIIAVAFSPSGKIIASASQDRTIKIWDLKAGQEVCTLSGHTGPVTSIAFPPDGKRLVSGSYDKTIRVWNLEALN